MYNWSTDTKKLKKNKEKYTIWKLEQLVNFGLNGKKISEKELRKYWSRLELDPMKKKYLLTLLHAKDSHKGTNRRSQSRRKK